MTPFGVCTHLDFIYGEKFNLAIQRHGFHGTDEIGRPGRDNLFLARYQGNPGRAYFPDDTVIILAREQAQRKADHAGDMTEHPIDRIMCFTGIRRAQNGRHDRPLFDT